MKGNYEGAGQKISFNWKWDEMRNISHKYYVSHRFCKGEKTEQKRKKILRKYRVKKKEIKLASRMRYGLYHEFLGRSWNQLFLALTRAKKKKSNLSLSKSKSIKSIQVKLNNQNKQRG
jgi:hypothetical protein